MKEKCMMDKRNDPTAYISHSDASIHMEDAYNTITIITTQFRVPVEFIATLTD